MLKCKMDFMKQLRLTSFNHHWTHLCFRLRVHFLPSEQVEVGCHDDLRSLVWSVVKEDLDNYSIRTIGNSSKNHFAWYWSLYSLYPGFLKVTSASGQFFCMNCPCSQCVVLLLCEYCGFLPQAKEKHACDTNRELQSLNVCECLFYRVMWPHNE